MHSLDLGGEPLNLDYTLACGQAFRWRRNETHEWTGVIGNKLAVVRMDGRQLIWSTYPEDDEQLIVDYFRLGDSVNAIYSALAATDERMNAVIERFYGLRLLRQDPHEALFSFVCSVANSIPRISAAIEAICSSYGREVCVIDGQSYHAFPTVQSLAEADEMDLRHAGTLAFRGPIVKSVAQQLTERTPDWLLAMRLATTNEARQSLTSLRGVGRKIADCVCLFGLDKDEAVPVDTHVRQLAQRLFFTRLNAKCVTNRVYDCVQQVMLERFGRYAGWAQQFLFYEDVLRSRVSTHALPNGNFH